MTLAVFGAGFGRTGTESMKRALEALGLGPCHHMTEVLNDPRQQEQWRDVAGGAAPDWDAIFHGYGAAVDWPSAYFWRELSAHYPDAKVLLTVRDAEGWYESFANTILKVLQKGGSPDSVGEKLIGEGVFGGRAHDRDHAIAVYEKSIADVRASLPPERLLTFHVGDGWEPLCRFLDRPVPDMPFPRCNTTADFQARFAGPGDGPSPAGGTWVARIPRRPAWVWVEAIFWGLVIGFTLWGVLLLKT